MEGNDLGAYIPGHPVHVAQAALRAISRDMIAGLITPAEARARQLALKATMTPRVRLACGMSAGMDDGEGDAPDYVPHPYDGTGYVLPEDDDADAPIVREAADDLTEQHRELLEILDTGATYAEAARRLGIGRAAVTKMAQRIRGILDAEDQADMLALWRVVRADEQQRAYDAELDDFVL